MKGLYRILRLFFCPHDYKITVNSGNVTLCGGAIIGRYYDKECKHCGKIRRFQFEV